MSAVTKFVIEAVAEGIGIPMSLKRVLKEHPDLRFPLSEPPKVVAMARRVKWDNWTSSSRPDRTVLTGWHFIRGLPEPQSIRVDVPELAETVQCVRTENWTCDIREVEGLASSKSAIETFATLDELAEARRENGFINEISEAKLQENLAHPEVRIMRSVNKADHFERHQWDGRLFLVNDGGSHHFAAARYIAGKLGRAVALTGRLDDYRLNQAAIATLRRRFALFTITHQDGYNELQESLRSFRTACFWLPLPSPYGHARILALPRDQSRSLKVAALLRERHFDELGEHLAELAGR